jgi:hypothetical protein
LCLIKGQDGREIINFNWELEMLLLSHPKMKGEQQLLLNRCQSDRINCSC